MDSHGKAQDGTAQHERRSLLIPIKLTVPPPSPVQPPLPQSRSTTHPPAPYLLPPHHHGHQQHPSSASDPSSAHQQNGVRRWRPYSSILPSLTGPTSNLFLLTDPLVRPAGTKHGTGTDTKYRSGTGMPNPTQTGSAQPSIPIAGSSHSHPRVFASNGVFASAPPCDVEGPSR